MPGRGHWQELCESLNNGDNNNLFDAHVKLVLAVERPIEGYGRSILQQMSAEDDVQIENLTMSLVDISSCEAFDPGW